MRDEDSGPSEPVCRSRPQPLYLETLPPGRGDPQNDWGSNEAVGLEKRGWIEQGFHADLLLFDPERFRDDAI
jgi:hypothetical protein